MAVNAPYPREARLHPHSWLCPWSAWPPFSLDTDCSHPASVAAKQAIKKVLTSVLSVFIWIFFQVIYQMSAVKGAAILIAARFIHIIFLISV
jgi:hypothetical protein